MKEETDWLLCWVGKRSQTKRSEKTMMMGTFVSWIKLELNAEMTQNRKIYLNL